MNKNILILCPIYAPYAGGGGQYFPLLVENILSINHFQKIIVVTEYHKQHNFIEKEDDLIILRIIPRRDSLENKSFFYSVLSFLCAYIIILTIIPILIMYHRVKIIQFTRYYYSPMFLVCSFLKKACKVKTIMDIRTNVEHDDIFRNAFGIDVFLSMSNNITKQLKRADINDNKIVEIPNVIKFEVGLNKGVDNNIINKLLKGSSKKFILFVGQLVERKSIFEVLEAFKLYRRTDPSIDLVLIGRDMLDLNSRGYLKLSDGVIFLGEQSRQTVLAFIRKALLILQPSKLEGVSRVSLEALYYRKKILLPNCVDEFVTSNPRFVVRENTSGEIYKKIVELIVSSHVPVYNFDMHNPKIHRENLKKLYKELLID